MSRAMAPKGAPAVSAAIVDSESEPGCQCDTVTGVCPEARRCFRFGPGCSNRRARVDVFGREGRSIMLVIVLLKVRI